MVLQYTQNLPGLKIEDDKYYLDQEDEEFFIKLEELFFDFEEVLGCDNLLDCEEILDKYGIYEPYSNSFKLFTERLKKHIGNNFVKGSVTGPFTMSTTLTDKSGKCTFYDDTLREVIVKTLIMKALWQIKEFKKATSATPIIFMDEPSISQVGSCAFITVKDEEVISIIEEVSNSIKKFGAMSGIHCCGKTNWEISTNAKTDIINFDAYSYTQSVSLYSSAIKKYLENGGYLALGIAPTLDPVILETLDDEGLYKKFEESLLFLINKGIDKDLILKQCFITPSCGCGSLSFEDTVHVVNLTKNLSMKLKEKYEGVLK